MNDSMELIKILCQGTLSISPLRYASKVLDRAALAGLLVVLVAFLDCQNLILSKSHYLMYCLALAMEPRWLVTLDENLQVCIYHFPRARGSFTREIDQFAL